MSMAQSPTISIPKKKTDDVDWTGPIRQVISHSYGESPDTYSSECAALQRCRQDAVKGAGSDITARDLLYKYFGQLELLELRFTDIRVVFPWHDAFTGKLTTQTSIAFEKASIIFQIAATHSAIAISQNRSDPEGLKRSFHYFKTAAGMLTYINDNFLHAPSTDLSKEVIKFLTGIMLAQATEVFYEKLVDEKKSATLISKVASQAAYLYTSLTEEVKEFMGRGIFDRNWVTLLQIKAKYFTALSQYQRSLADSAASLHGEALTRLTVAETQAKEAARLARNFNSDFLSTLSPTLPPDAGSSIVDLTKNLQTLLTEKKAEAQRDNDLIYNAICPPEATLSAIDKLSVATPIPIQEVYGTPEIQKIIGPDMFAKLIPLSVHEGASVYSEEKAKLVRAEAEKAEIADSDARAALDSMGLPAGLRKWRELVAGHDDEDALPKEVEAWAEEVARGDGIHGIDRQFEQLEGLKRKVDQELGIIAQELESESRECETMRVKYDLLWEQEPSAGFTRSMRQDMKAHRDAFSAASASDARVVELWNSVHPDLILLLAGNDAISGFLTAAENANTSAAGPSLLDLADDVRSNDTVDVADIKRKVNDIEERIGRINKIKRERSEVLKDLKEKIQTDDVSQLLLLNRRSPNVEPGLFATELEKFRPYQSRLASTVQVQQSVIDEISSLFKLLTSNPRSKEWMKKADLREKRRGDAIARLSRAREGWSETSDTLRKGLQFYQDLYGLVSQLKRSVSSYVATRADERRKLVAKAEAASVSKAKAASSTGPPPPPPPKSPITGLEGQFTSMGFGQPQLPPPPPQIPGSWGATSPPPPAQYPPPPTQSPASVSSPYSAFPPPPPRVGSLPPPPPPPSIPSQPPQGDPYARLFDAPGLSAQFAFGQSPAPPPPPPSSNPPPSMQTAPPPPPQSSQQYYGYAPQQPSSPYSYSAPGYPSQQPAPPPPPPQQPGHYWQPPPGQQPYPPPPNAGQQYGGYSR